MAIPVASRLNTHPRFWVTQSRAIPETSLTLAGLRTPQMMNPDDGRPDDQHDPPVDPIANPLILDGHPRHQRWVDVVRVVDLLDDIRSPASCASQPVTIGTGGLL